MSAPFARGRRPLPSFDIPVGRNYGLHLVSNGGMPRLAHCAALLTVSLGCTPAGSKPEPAPTAAHSPSGAATKPPPGPETRPERRTQPEPEPALRPTDPSWHDVEIGEACVLRMAQAPAALTMPMEWQACDGGGDGCLETTTALEESPMVGYTLQGFHGAEGIITVARLSLPGPLTRMLVGPLDGDPFLAIELSEGEGCELGGIAMGDDEGVLEVAYDHAHGYASRAYLQGPLHQSPQWSTVAARLLRRDYPGFIAESVASVGGRVFVLASGGPLRTFDVDADRWVEIAETHRGWTCCMNTSTELIALTRESIPEVVVGTRLGADAVPLLEPARGGGVSELRFDGDRAVWVEGEGRNANNEYRRVELWTGRLDSTPAIVDRRRVVEIGGRFVSPPLVGGGMALVWSRNGGARHTLFVVRLADGARWELPPMELRQALWIDEGELAVELGPPGAVVGPKVLRRLPLGPGTGHFEALP